MRGNVAGIQFIMSAQVSVWQSVLMARSYTVLIAEYATDAGKLKLITIMRCVRNDLLSTEPDMRVLPLLETHLT